MNNLKQCITLAALGLTVLAQPAHATFDELIGRFSTGLEESSAIAAFETYQRLKLESGCLDNQRTGQVTDQVTDQITDASSAQEPITRPTTSSRPTCTGRTFDIFKNVREIVHTGNDLTGSGSTEYSLGSNLEGLGFALRWLAAEEYAAQGDMSSDFASGQVSGLSSRLSALRFGARGFQFASNGVWQPDTETAGLIGENGGAAGEGSNYSRVGGFLNFQYGHGSRTATQLEDAFDLAATSVNFGLDYRITDEWIAGAIIGYSKQEIDFDASQSIVEGGIESSGLSFMPFFMYQPGSFYLSGSYGLQQMSFDSVRSIRYPSFNPSIDSANTDTVSSSKATTSALFLEAGYNFFWKKFSLEPYANLSSTNVIIDEFSERDINDDGFDLVIKKQDFTLTDASIGVKFQYTFTPKHGVLVPYFTVESVNQLNSDSRNVEAYYTGLTTNDTLYNTPTEELDGSYLTLNFGASAVLRGGREKTPGGSVFGDLQAFVNYKTISGLEGYSLHFYTLGLRYAF